jgi:tRNA 2-thiouridine synthesizing protein C
MMNQPTPRKTFLILSRQAPYGGYKAQQCIDLALASAVFEQDIIFAFLGDGVLQLLSNQSPGAIDAKPIGGALETLQLYGIEEVYVEQSSLADRRLGPADLVLEAKLMDADKLIELINKADCVFNL